MARKPLIFTAVSGGVSQLPQTRVVRRERRVLLTLDKGIADVRAHPSEAHAGIVLFRPPAAGRGTILLFVRRHLASLFERELTGRLL
jgi:hypothetical protein